MAKITVDGTEYEVTEGRTILQALDDLGVLMSEVEIPHYCWHPKLSIDGSCRLCQVEIEGFPKLQIACNTPVSEGMVVHTQSAMAKAGRQGVLELLLINHPLDCPICDQAGECELQDFVFQEGRPGTRYAEYPKRFNPVEDFGPDVLYVPNRCILCTRCVRFMEDVAKEPVLNVSERGDRAFIGGADLNELAALTPDTARLFITRLHQACQAIRDCPVPVIGRIGGFCLGAGLELAASCDFLMAAEGAQLGMPEVQMGIPSVIEAALLPGLIGWGRTREMLLTGEPMPAERLYAAGVVNALSEPGGAADAAVAMGERIAANGPVAVRACLRAVNEFVGANDGATWAANDEAAWSIRGSADVLEGVQAFLEKREPRWTGR